MSPKQVGKRDVKLRDVIHQRHGAVPSMGAKAVRYATVDSAEQVGTESEMINAQ